MKAFWARHKVAILATFGVIAVAGSITAWRGWDYIQNDPTFCTSCHLMDDAFGRWSESGHKKVNCHTCHPGDLMSNLHQMWVTITESPDAVVKHAEVPASICGSCHLSTDPRWKQIGQSAGHAVHWGEHRIECVTCHAPQVHQFVPTDQMCEKCHSNQVVGLSPMQKQHCTTCHDYMGDSARGLIPTSEDCGRCHADAGDSPIKLHTGWHEGFDCSTCHPVHDAVGVLAADGPSRDGAALPCTECHADQVEAMAHATGPHERCATCHEPHADPAVEPRCRACHEEESDKVGVRDHHACVDCHRPHLPGEVAADTCADCHRENARILADTPVPEHQTCENCHDPHADRKPDTPQCQDCHEDKAHRVRSAEAPAHRSCQSCHEVHAPSEAATCVRCHRAERADVLTGPREHQRCTGCHGTHGRAAAPKDDCGRCHKAILAATVGEPTEHLQCSKCHTAHRPKDRKAAPCASCHAERTRRVAALPVEHQKCQSCHPWHVVDDRVTRETCLDCHEGIGKQFAARGPDRVTAAAHQDCGRCHAPHKERAPKQCADCHRKQVNETTGSVVAKHRDCKACHGVRAHDVGRATPPRSCDGCHPDVRQDGLHAHEEHRACPDCHDGHDPQAPAAAACVRCHDMKRVKRHPKEADGVSQCNGCHRFR